MITIDKYGQSIKIFDGEVNMFFDKIPVKRGVYIVKATGIVWLLEYVTAPYTDFVINGVPITTIEEFTTQFVLAIPTDDTGGGDKFGIGDNISTENRGVDMQNYSLTLSTLSAGATPLLVTSLNGGSGIQSTATGSAGSVGVGGNSDIGVGVQGAASGAGYGISGYADGGGTPLDLTRISPDANSVLRMAYIHRETSGTAANGIGASFDFCLESANASILLANQIISKFIDATDVTSQLILSGVSNGVLHNYTFPPFTADRTIPVSFQGVFADVNGNIEPYKVYTALLNQATGPTDEPTLSVMQNSVGAVVWSRSSTGRYVGTLTGAFTANKTICVPTTQGSLVGLFNTLPFDYGYAIYPSNSINDILLDVYKTSDGSFADLFTAIAEISIFIEIRVYP